MSALLVLAPLAPLLAALAAVAAPARLAAPALGLAMLPGLWAGLAAGGAQGRLTGLLFGADLRLHPDLAPAMAAVALLWGAAALHAMAAGGPAAQTDSAGARFRVCFGLAAAGQMGVFVAADLASFYVAFATLSFAGYGLVAHRDTPQARRAARVYIVFVVLGELALFAGLILIAAAREGSGAPTLSGLAPPPAAWWLLTVGFGVKAGLVPLHVWLPLAHPVAPVPASAALSGGTLKAGLVGMALFLPPGAAPPGFGETLMALGLVGVFGAALWGVAQRDPKVVLAYSSVSQMGLALAVTGAVSAAPSVDGAGPGLVAVIGLFALHHALAKGALFLAVQPGLPRAVALAAAAFAALSMTGAPLTLGYAVKAALTEAAPALGSAVTLSAWGTAALTARALWRMREGSAEGDALRGASLLGLAATLLGAPFLLGVDLGVGSAASALPAATVVIAAVVAIRMGVRMPPAPPPGDLAPVFEGAAHGGLRVARTFGATLGRLRDQAMTAALAGWEAAKPVAIRLADPGEADDDARWRLAGIAAAAAFVALAVAASAT
jgi:formate hydrogenlyase subunit 3/multisubunit Na+/H+ antiporter MnhD subunit